MKYELYKTFIQKNSSLTPWLLPEILDSSLDIILLVIWLLDQHKTSDLKEVRKVRYVCLNYTKETKFVRLLG